MGFGVAISKEVYRSDLKAVATLASCLGLSVEASYDMISGFDPCLLYLDLRSLVWLHPTLY